METKRRRANKKKGTRRGGKGWGRWLAEKRGVVYYKNRPNYVPKQSFNNGNNGNNSNNSNNATNEFGNPKKYTFTERLKATFGKKRGNYTMRND
jgi:hypothetical protein